MILRKTFLSKIVLLFLVFTPSNIIAETSLKLELIIEGQDEVCREVAKIAQSIPKRNFLLGTWKTSFNGIKWDTGEHSTVTAEGNSRLVPFKYKIIDIDNNGDEELVVLQTTSISSIETDFLYIMEPEQLENLNKGSFFNSAIQINQRNYVVYLKGQSTLPTEMVIWKYKSKYYLIMKEKFFAKGNKNYPDSLTVGEVTGKIETDKSGLSRVILKMNCRLKNK